MVAKAHALWADHIGKTHHLMKKQGTWIQTAYSCYPYKKVFLSSAGNVPITVLLSVLSWKSPRNSKALGQQGESRFFTHITHQPEVAFILLIHSFTDSSHNTQHTHSLTHSLTLLLL